MRTGEVRAGPRASRPSANRQERGLDLKQGERDQQHGQRNGDDNEPHAVDVADSTVAQPRTDDDDLIGAPPYLIGFTVVTQRYPMVF